MKINSQPWITLWMHFINSHASQFAHFDHHHHIFRVINTTKIWAKTQLFGVTCIPRPKSYAKSTSSSPHKETDQNGGGQSSTQSIDSSSSPHHLISFWYVYFWSLKRYIKIYHSVVGLIFYHSSVTLFFAVFL